MYTPAVFCMAVACYSKMEEKANCARASWKDVVLYALHEGALFTKVFFSYKMQSASLSTSAKTTCSLAEDMRRAPCHMAYSRLREECQTTFTNLGGGSCLPVTQGTKVPSRCSGASSSV